MSSEDEAIDSFPLTRKVCMRVFRPVVESAPGLLTTFMVLSRLCQLELGIKVS